MVRACWGTLEFARITLNPSAFCWPSANLVGDFFPFLADTKHKTCASLVVISAALIRHHSRRIQAGSCILIQHLRRFQRCSSVIRGIYHVFLSTLHNYPCIVPITLTLLAANRLAEACVG